jgi:glutathione S-transferase
MKLHWSPRSPFVRKIMIAAHELGLTDQLDCVRTVVATATPHQGLLAENPLSKLPTLVADDGTVVYDSPVILDYLDHLEGAPKLHPREPKARLLAMRRQALGDGMLDFLLLWLFERGKPEAKQTPEVIAAFRVKLAASLDILEKEANELAAAPFDVGQLTIGVALGYVDFRFPAEDWRATHPKLAAWYASFLQRPSVQANIPSEG